MLKDYGLVRKSSNHEDHSLCLWYSARLAEGEQLELCGVALSQRGYCSEVLLFLSLLLYIYLHRAVN